MAAIVRSILLVGIPILLLGLIVGGHIVGGILGPPAIWERTRHSPPRTDLIGTYMEAERHWDHSKTGPNAIVELRLDGSMSVRPRCWSIWFRCGSTSAIEFVHASSAELISQCVSTAHFPVHLPRERYVVPAQFKYHFRCNSMHILRLVRGCNVYREVRS